MIAYCVNCGLSGPVEEFDDDGFTCSGCGSSDIRVKVRRLRTAKRASKEKQMTITGMTTLWPTSKRWICTECGLISHAAGVGRHQQCSGHSGRSRIDNEETAA